MRGVSQRPDGSALNYKTTKCEAACAEGMFDTNICAFLRRKDGEGTVVEFSIGVDVPWIPVARQYRALQAIFQ